MNYDREFIRNCIYTAGRQLSGYLLSIISMVVVTRYLGPEGQGTNALAHLLPGALIILFNFGIGTAAVYHVGRNITPIAVIFNTTLVASLGLSILASLVGAVVAAFFSHIFFADVSSQLLFLALASLPFTLLYQMLIAIFQGKQDFGVYNSTALIYQLVILLLSITLVVFFNLGVLGAVWSTVLGSALTVIYALYYILKTYKLKLSLSLFSKEYLKQSLTYGIKTYTMNLITFGNYRANMFMLAYFTNVYIVGLYTIAIAVAEKMWFISHTVSTVLFPRIASLNEKEARNELTSAICRSVLAISALGAVVVYFLSDLVVLVLVGGQFKDASLAINILLPGIVALSSDRILSNDLAGRGIPEYNTYVSTFTLILNLILNYVMIPHWGLSGAALATSITYTVTFLIKSVIFKRVSGQEYIKFLLISKEDISLFVGFAKPLLIALKNNKKG